ncbi:MAG: hypothetical protein ACE5G9_12730 [Nitrospinales bacterium]
MYVEVESCPNVDAEFSMVYKEVTPPREVYCIEYDAGAGEKPMQVTGWDAAADSPCPSYACKIDESGDGRALLIFGGSGGIRMKELEDPSPWNSNSPSQWGETHLVYPANSFIVYKDQI